MVNFNGPPKEQTNIADAQWNHYGGAKRGADPEVLKDLGYKDPVDLYSLGQNPEDQPEPAAEVKEPAEPEAEVPEPRSAKHARDHHGGPITKPAFTLVRSAAQSPAVRSSAGYEAGGSAKRVEADAFSRHPRRVTEMWPEPAANTDSNDTPVQE